MTERYMVNDTGTVIDKVTRDNYELAFELVSILNNYENTLNMMFDSTDMCEQLYYEYSKLLVENIALKQSNNELVESLDEEINSFNKQYDKINKECVELKSVNMEYEDALGRLEEENKQLKKKYLLKIGIRYS